MCKPASYEYMSSDDCIYLHNIHALSRYNTLASPIKILSEVFQSLPQKQVTLSIFFFSPSWMNLACCRTFFFLNGLITYVCESVRLFTKRHVFEMRPWFYVYQWSVSFYCWILSHDFIWVCLSILRLWPSRLFLDFGQLWVKWLWQFVRDKQLLRARCSLW